MSIKIMSRVWEKSKQGGSPLLLLLAIADNANDNGFAWPGQEYLARKIRMNKRSIPRLTKKLQEARELFVIDRGGQGKSNQYIVTTGMEWSDFAASLQTHLKYTDEKCSDIYPWFCGNGGDKLSTPDYRGDDIAVSGGDDKLSGGDDIAMSTEPSLTINKPSIMPQIGENHQKAFDDTEAKAKLNKLAPYFAKQCQGQLTRDELKDYVRLGYQMAQEVCPLNILGASPKALQALARSTWVVRSCPDKDKILKSFSNWWYNEYWAGKKGQSPTPAQVGDTWGQFETFKEKPQVTNHTYTPNLSDEKRQRLAELIAEHETK